MTGAESPQTLHFVWSSQMPIPDANSAHVPALKVAGHLLNLSHPVGGPKARWFSARGFDASDAAELTEALVRIVRSSDDYHSEVSRYGTKYVVRGQLECPDGSRPTIETVWIVESGSSHPRLITAYPVEVGP